jgi:hypothetical protein
VKAETLPDLDGYTHHRTDIDAQFEAGRYKA